ncbi:MAG TPA: TRAP transporter small permease [Alphaproteobacteria bacterium]|jgi:TRAP-type C4-dicarboxylate transport system permease small subunit|nr:TRAP transporter small permease [Alphaproteobacteria bacterium]
MDHPPQVSIGSVWGRALGALAAIGGIAVVALMMITVVDIVGRNLGILYLQGVIEISNLTIVFLGFLGLAYCFNVGGHIVVDLATATASPRIVMMLDGFWLLIAAGIYALMAVLMWDEGFGTAASGEVSANLQWSPLTFFLPCVLGAAVTAVTCLALGIKTFRSLPPRRGAARLT